MNSIMECDHILQEVTIILDFQMDLFIGEFLPLAKNMRVEVQEKFGDIDILSWFLPQIKQQLNRV